MHVAQHYIRGRAFAAPSPDASTELFPHDRVHAARFAGQVPAAAPCRCDQLQFYNYSSTTTVVRLLLNAYPKSAQAVDLVSAPPAHPRGPRTARASARAEREARGGRYTKRAATHPRRSSQYESLPLHTAAMNNAPARVVWLLLRAYPDGAKAKDKVTAPRVASPTYPPLLLASVACRLCKVGTYSLAAARSPRRVAQFGRLPLHNAVGKAPSQEVVQLLLDAYPDGANATDCVSAPCRPDPTSPPRAAAVRRR